MSWNNTRLDALKRVNAENSISFLYIFLPTASNDVRQEQENVCHSDALVCLNVKEGQTFISVRAEMFGSSPELSIMSSSIIMLFHLVIDYTLMV